MHFKTPLYLTFLLPLSWYASCEDRFPYIAVVKTPVADLSTTKLSRYQGETETHYRSFPFSPDKGFSSCFRGHQLKFNELVRIIDSSEDEHLCEVLNCSFQNKDKEELSKFWILKKHVASLQRLSKKIDLTTIPEAITAQKSFERCNRNVLTLIKPWYDPKTKSSYSVGTRFVRCSQKDTKDYYGVFIIDGTSLRSTIRLVPQKSGLVRYPRSPNQAISLFISILRGWCSQEKTIPYVFGGSSFSGAEIPKDFSLRAAVKCGCLATFWERNYNSKSPLQGFDCSNMILCAAQLSTIPYFCKNTTTLSAQLRPLRKNEKLELGDLIWYPGHVVVVSDIHKNLLIEAIGYDAGYGKVHEISIDKVFQDIKSYKDLIAAYENADIIKRLNNKGEPFRSIDFFKILKLRSVWLDTKKGP